MTLLTQPQARIPIGWATVAGQRIAVEVDPEWMRYLFALDERAGGVSGVGTTELSIEAFEDAGIEEIKAVGYSMADAAGQVPIASFNGDALVDAMSQIPVAFVEQIENVLTELADTRAQVAELIKTIQDMKQGQFT